MESKQIDTERDDSRLKNKLKDKSEKLFSHKIKRRTKK